VVLLGVQLGQETVERSELAAVLDDVFACVVGGKEWTLRRVIIHHVVTRTHSGTSRCQLRVTHL
jgi:hypothetical protein